VDTVPEVADGPGDPLDRGRLPLPQAGLFDGERHGRHGAAPIAAVAALLVALAVGDGELRHSRAIPFYVSVIEIKSM
jgi:hypothetical protein